MIAGAHAVLWVRQDGTGNDACRFAETEKGFLIDGASTGADGTVRKYRIRTRDDGTTRRVRIGQKSRLVARRKRDGSWTLNDTAVPAVTGATDIALEFTPATFTLPLRRLKLKIGQEAEILAAKLDVAAGRLEPLQMMLKRVSEAEYDCAETETGRGARITVDPEKIVQVHEGHWIAQD
ncbi:MAG: putative glycolipid-binding domain-containing protein [Roseovarius sp.]